MPRPSPLTESILSKSTVGRSVGADIYNAQPGQKVGHVTILSNSGAKLPGKAGKKQAASAPPWGRVVGGDKGRVVLAFSIPPRPLWPNASRNGAWWVKSKPVKAHKTLARDKTEEAMKAGGIEGGWGRAVLTAAFYFPDARRRDPDGAAGCLKAYQDGITAAKLLADDNTRHLRIGEPTFDIDRACPRVEITIRKVRA